MLTNDQLETLIQNLIDRLNRVEAETARRVADMTADLFATQLRVEGHITSLAARKDRLYTKRNESGTRSPWKRGTV